jgi:hypothetical protein|tara:strand:+ start:260 stop:466 length:207 start_codon:yes stop_codon:yes gene_type:complete
MDLQEGLKRNLTQAIGKEINVRIADDVTSIGTLVDINDSALMIDEPPYMTLVPLRSIKIVRIRATDMS